MFSHAFGAVAGDRRESFGIRRSLKQRERKRFLIALPHQNSAPAVLDRFRNPAMLGGENRQAARHRFEHGVRNAFLVSVAADFAGVQKNMRLIKEFAQLGLGNETGKENFIGDAEFGGELAELIPERAFTGDGERRSRIARREFRERPQAHAQSFLFNEPAGLDEFPGAIGWPRARAKRNFVDRYSGMWKPDLSRLTAEVNQSPA